jgi:hypothetical protein
LITRLTPGVLLPPDHRHELKFLIPITLLDMTTITVIDHGMSLSVLYLNEHNFKYLFQALVRPHLEYAAAVWSPYKQYDIDNIENVQRKATKQIPSLKDMDYGVPR